MTVANSSGKIIYADNAATTKIDDEALNLMIDLQKNFFVNPSSAYKLSRPLKKILKESREKIFHMDAVQAVGHIPIDVKLLDVDMLSASAHKFNDPKGIGFLYVRDELKILPYIDGGGQEFLKRAGTENVPAIAAMVLALEKNCRAMKRNAEKLSDVSKILLDCLNGVDFILNGGKNRLPGHLSLSFKNCEGETPMHRLDLKNIYVATGLACNSQQMQISHVLQALNVPKDYINGTIKITFGKENSHEDAEIIGEILTKILQKLVIYFWMLYNKNNTISSGKLLCLFTIYRQHQQNLRREKFWKKILFRTAI